MKLLRHFLHPRGTAGHLPFGRAIILMQVVAALIAVAYMLGKDRVGMPLVSDKPYEVRVAFRDAQGLDEKDQPPAMVAGADFGRVVEVKRQGGMAIARIELGHEVRGRIFADATAQLRPVSSLQNLALNIDPGSPQAGPLPDDRPIPVERVRGYVNTDRVLDVLDADTRAYVQLLLGEAARGLRDRPGELRRAVAQLGSVSDSSAVVADALADRRKLLSRLVAELDTIFATTAERDGQLAEVVDTGSRALRVSADREQDLADTFRQLPPTLRQARRALAGVQRLATDLDPALSTLRPTARRLPEGMRALREFVPTGLQLMRDLQALAKDGRAPVRSLRSMAQQLGPAATSLRPAVERLGPILRPIDENRRGIGPLVDNWSGILSTNDVNTTRFRGIHFGYDELRPEHFGMPRSAARDGKGGHSELELKLARALELFCARVNPVACITRFRVPDLPKERVSAFKAKERRR